MPLTEFGLIDRYFRAIGPALDSTVRGVGDDCAVLRPPEDQLLLVTTDTLVENIHFLAGSDPESLGHKSLAVNLSDLAAMGATPEWVTLALTLPDVNESWLEAFAGGFSALAERYRVQLVGGDTTRGPLSICVQALGTAAAERILYRSTASPGDGIYVTGTIGDAGLALKYLEDPERHCPKTLRDRLDRPEPRIEAGQSIGGLASACIDISDGLVADLGHLLQASHAGATLDWNLIPLSPAVRQYVEQSRDFNLPLCAGDDYELCFTVPPIREQELIRAVGSLPYPCQRVGTIDQRPGLRIENGGPGLDLKLGGYEHFS
ncbi:MAG: thiamine-phosphate kinase [Methylococcales bacterium]